MLVVTRVVLSGTAVGRVASGHRRRDQFAGLISVRTGAVCSVQITPRRSQTLRSRSRTRKALAPG
jgi:hypothetical protein